MPATDDEQRPLHAFELKTTDVTLTVAFSSEGASSNVPLFHDQATIAGTVTLILSRKQNVQAVVLKVTGVQRRANADVDDQVFLELATTMWTAKDKFAPGASQEQPFEFTLPRQLAFATLASNGKPIFQRFPLPPSFVVQGFPLYLMYEITCIIKRGRFKSDEVLRIPIRYIPHTEAPPPSAMRILSYKGQIPLLDPDADPSGWMSTSVELRAHLSTGREVTAACSFSLAAPSSYPVGYPLPFHVLLAGADAHTLGQLGAGLHVILTRHLGTTPPLFVSRGRTWVPEEGDSDPRALLGRQVLVGEIAVPSQALPSFSYKTFSLSYFVTFTIEPERGITLAQPCICMVPVTITMNAAPGPLPVSYAPPVDRAEERPSPPLTSPSVTKPPRALPVEIIARGMRA